MRFPRFHLAVLPLGLACSAIVPLPGANAQSSPSSAPVKTAFSYLDDEAEAGGFDVTAAIGKLPVQMIIAEQENGDGYLLRMSADGSDFGLRRKGVLRALATSREKVYTGALTVQRRGQRLRVINGNRVLLEVEDATWSEGRIGFSGSLKDARVQPVEDVFFDDDFMRVKESVALAAAKTNPKLGIRVADVKESETLWRAVAGQWSTTGLSENSEAQVAQSANAFAFRPTTAGTNLALSGRAFWNDYVVETSVRPEGATAIGLAAYAQDQKNYLLLHWTNGENGKLQLRAVVDGAVRVLDENNGSFEAKQWYRLKVAVAGGMARAWIDDVEVLRARTGLFGRGAIGVYCENPTPTLTADFDDVRVRSIRNFHDDFSTHVPGRWQTVTGSWRMKNAAVPTDARGAFAVMGERDWSDYVVSSEIALKPDASAGLVLHHQNGAGAYLLRVTGSKSRLPFAGKAQIVKIAGGKTVVLAEQKTGADFDAKSRMWNFSSEDGYLKATAGGTRIVDAFDESLKAGRAGVYAQNGSSGAAQLRAFGVEFPEVRPTWAKVPELFVEERQAETMGGWSTPQGFWASASPLADAATPTANSGVGNTVAALNAGQSAARKTGTALWHKGAFWGDGRVGFQLPKLEAGQVFGLSFTTAAKSNAGGWSKAPSPLQMSLAIDKSTLKTTLSRTPDKSSKPLWSGDTKLDGAPTDYNFELLQRGTFLIGRLKKAKGETSTTLFAARVN
jgi:hypothetical protein